MWSLAACATVCSESAALSPGCAEALLLELAIVAMPHRNRPVASATVVSPQPAGLVASASDWERSVDAPLPFDVSGPSQMKPENWREVCGITQCKGWGTKQTHKEDRCWSGTGLESTFSDSALPCQPQLDRDRDRDRDGDRDRDLKQNVHASMRWVNTAD